MSRTSEISNDRPPRPRWGMTQVAGYAVLAAASLAVLGGYVSAVKTSTARELTWACLSLQPQRLGVKPPDFDLPDLAGDKTRLSRLRGKVVLLNFWATWCPPCVEELPSLFRLNRTDLGPEFALLTVSVDETAAQVKRFFSLKGWSKERLPVVMDPQQRLAARLGTTKFPETYLLDRQGMVRFRFINKRDWSTPQALACIRSMIRISGAAVAAQ